MQQLGLRRLASEPTAYTTARGDAHILCYVDDLLFTQNSITELFKSIQQYVPYDQQETSQLATPHASWAETSATKVIT